MYISLFKIFLLLPFCMPAQGLIIPAGGYIIANNGNLVLNSNWVNNGSFTHNGGTVIFAGGTQTLGGSSASNFNNLTTSATSTTTITSPGHSIKNILLSNGTLNANGNLTLLSTAAKTAAVNGSGSGEIYGNLVVQRYITSGFGYKYFSSPFQADTVGDFSNDMNLNAAFPTFYRHDENQASNGWITYTSGSGALNPMQGYAANLGASNTAKTVDLKGVVNNHNLSLNLFNHNMTYTQGFNLVGNPYPSPINWDAVGGWTKTNIDNAIYFFNAGTTNQYTGVYSSYINGVSSDGIAGSTIAAMQGFFVHVSNGSYPVAAVLGVNNSARIINSAANFFRIEGQPGNPSLLRLSVGFAEQTDLADPLVFYFDDAAAGKFDKKLDALKLMNTDSLVPSLYAVSADTKRLSIHALAATHDTLTMVPLGLITKKDGWVSFNAKDMQGLPAPLYVYLADTKTGLNQDLQKDPLYRLFLTAGEYDNRFFLKFSSKTLDGGTATTSSTEAFSVYSAGGRLFVNGHLAAGEKASLTVINMLGQVVGRYEIAGNTYTPLPVNFSSGLYLVNIKGPSKNYSKKIFAGTQ